jgi:hypothetical protein
MACGAIGGGWRERLQPTGGDESCSGVTGGLGPCCLLLLHKVIGGGGLGGSEVMTRADCVVASPSRVGRGREI